MQKHWKKELYIKYKTNIKPSSYILLKHINKKHKFFFCKKKTNFNLKYNHLYFKISNFFFTRKYVKYNKK